MPFHDGSASFFIPRVIILHPFPINFYHTSVYVLQCCSVAVLQFQNDSRKSTVN